MAKVLVVEGDPALAAEARRSLARDHDVEGATSLVGLQRLASGARFDLVLCVHNSFEPGQLRALVRDLLRDGTSFFRL